MVVNVSSQIQRLDNGTTSSSSSSSTSTSTSTSSRSLRTGNVITVLVFLTTVAAILYVESIGLNGPTITKCTTAPATNGMVDPIHTGATTYNASLVEYRGLPSWYVQTKELTANMDMGWPTMDQPFIFFHQRKTGGSSIRRAMAKIANSTHKQSAYIPCELGMKCQIYHTSHEMNTGRSVYGGHLFYTSVLKTLYNSHSPHRGKARIATTGTGTGTATHTGLPPPGNMTAKTNNTNATTTTTTAVTPDTPLLPVPDYVQPPNFTCLTIFRDPVDRIQSCWNYRMVQDRRGRNKNEGNVTTVFANLSAHNLDHVLTYSRSYHMEGCLHEPMRIFTDVGMNEQLVNGLHLPQYERWVGVILQQTMERMGQCVVGIIERTEDTQRAMERFLPWLAAVNPLGSKLNEGRTQRGKVTGENLQLVQRVAKYEQYIYEVANHMLDVQLGKGNTGGVRRP